MDSGVAPQLMYQPHTLPSSTTLLVGVLTFTVQPLFTFYVNKNKESSLRCCSELSRSLCLMSSYLSLKTLSIFGIISM